MAKLPTNGVALWDYLTEEWDAKDIPPTRWAREHGLADATVLRWRDGGEPDMRSLKRIAEALGRPLYEVLLGAEYITKEELGRPIEPRPPLSVEESVRLDPDLTDNDREVLLGMYRALVTHSASTRKPKVPRATQKRTPVKAVAKKAAPGRRGTRKA